VASHRLCGGVTALRTVKPSFPPVEPQAVNIFHIPAPRTPLVLAEHGATGQAGLWTENHLPVNTGGKNAMVDAAGRRTAALVGMVCRTGGVTSTPGRFAHRLFATGRMTKHAANLPSQLTYCAAWRGLAAKTTQGLRLPGVGRWGQPPVPEFWCRAFSGSAHAYHACHDAWRPPERYHPVVDDHGSILWILPTGTSARWHTTRTHPHTLPHTRTHLTLPG